jgi:hypothetical protein
MRTKGFGWIGPAVLLSAMLMATSASAYDPYDPNNCNGFIWDDKQAVVVSKVIARPRVNFVKSPYDDDFKAETCPADTAACRKKSYLVAGDLVLTGETRGAFTCVSYHLPQARTQIWTTGWVPGSALTPVAPMPSPKVQDWTGTWSLPAGEITISPGGAGGKLSIEGVMVVPFGRDFNNGVLRANASPEKDTIAFNDDGSLPFEQTECADCRVRMQRIGEWLMVEDNERCGGAAVTFTGLYRRKK